MHGELRIVCNYCFVLEYFTVLKIN